MEHLRIVKRFAFVASAASAALLITEACSDVVSDTLVDAGAMLVDGGAGDGGGIMAEAGQLMLEAGTNIRDARSDVAAQVAAAFKSGSRIKMRVTVQQGADGSQYGGYPTPFDTTLNGDCSLGVAADGKTRCLPKNIAIQAAWFANGACTVPLAVDPYPCSSSTAPTYASSTVPGNAFTCMPKTTTRIFTLGAAHTGSAYLKSGTACTATAVPKGWKAYSQGTEVAPATFVEFTDSAPETL